MMQAINESQVYLKEIEYEDALDFKDRGLFDDPYLKGYNYGDFSDMDIRMRYYTINMPRKRYFAVKDRLSGKMVGFIGMKKINPLAKKSLLGIVFDPNYVSQGLGYEAMTLFLDYYFGELSYSRLDLEVNEFNTRAIRLYEKLGFLEVGETLQVFENQDIDPDPRYFVEEGGTIYAKIRQMVKYREKGE